MRWYYSFHSGETSGGSACPPGVLFGGRTGELEWALIGAIEDNLNFERVTAFSEMAYGQRKTV